MKRTIVYLIQVVFMLFFVGVKPTHAQRPTGDVINGVEPTYFYNSFNNWAASDTGGWQSHVFDFFVNHTANFMGAGNYIGGIQLYTEHPLKVIGIAAAGFVQPWFDTTIPQYMSYYYDNPQMRELHHEYFFPNTLDTVLAHRVTDSLILYKPTGNNITRLASGPWRVEDPHRYITLPPHIWEYTDIIFNYDSTPVVPIYEVLFKSPVVVEDSFIVAGTALNNDVSSVRCTVDWQWHWMDLWNVRPTRYWWVRSPDLDARDTNDIMWVYPYEVGSWIRDIRSDYYFVWTPTDSTQVPSDIYYTLAPVMFPIIEPDFDTVLCHQVQNVRVVARTDSSATLAWTSVENGPWEVAYGKLTDTWDNFTFITTNSPTATLGGLQVGTTYLAMVRSFCEITQEYGEWSQVTEVEVYGHHGPTGIAQTGDLDRFTQMMPNPAHGQVSILSSYRLTGITVYDLQGRKVLEQEADGISATVDISPLAAGTYVVAIETPAGVATKKLEVAY